MNARTIVIGAAAAAAMIAGSLLALPFIAPAQAATDERCRVVKWIDGDTVTVQCGVRRYSVRLEAVNAGDVYYGECMALEARNYVRRTFPAGATVTLAHTNGGADRDGHGRLLRAVFGDDGTNAALALIARGLAKFPRQAERHPYASIYAAAEKAARQADIGIWGDCGGRERPWG